MQEGRLHVGKASIGFCNYPSSGLENIIEFFHGLVGGEAEIVRNQFRLRSSPAPYVDAAVFYGSRERAKTDVALLGACEIVASARQKGGRITLRLTDDAVARLGERLERGQNAGLDTGDLVAGKRFLVDLADPNLTKALHVGHFRGLVIGRALASAIRCSGGDVCVLSLVNDFGRSICEAMAGYLQFHANETPESTGLRPDVFVGICYADYVQNLHNAHAHELTQDAAIGREFEDRRDLADDLVNKLRAEDPETLQLWRKIREWVLRGHDKTYDRLKIRIHRPLYESDSLDGAMQLANEGLRRAIFCRDARGGLVFQTGRQEYQRIPLLHQNGCPTENLRLAAIWRDLQHEGVDLEACLHIMGEEWVVPIACREQMLHELMDCPLYDRYHKIGYGTVLVDGSKMKSSDGGAVLVEELLDCIKGLEQVRRLAAECDDRVTAESLAMIIASGWFLCESLSKRVEFSWDQLRSENRNPGWILARAWSLAHQCGYDDTADPDPIDADYRFAVLQSQNVRWRLQDVVTQFNVSSLARFLIFLSKWYCTAPKMHLRCSRVVRTTLRAGFTSLGIV